MATEKKDRPRISYSFANGVHRWFSVEHAMSAELDMARMHVSLVGRPNEDGSWPVATVHGCKQKAADAAATDMGTPIPERLANISETCQRLMTGDSEAWNERALPELARAIIAAGLKQDTPEFRANFRALTAGQKSALSAVPEVARELDRIRSAAGRGVDAGALLAKL